MTVSSLLEILAISESQTQKATAINTAISQMESAIAESYSLDTADATTAGYDVVIPFDDTNDLTDRTALRLVYLVLDAGAAADFNVIHPDNKHWFFVKNDTAYSATVKTASGTGITLSGGRVMMLYCDGTNIVDIMSSFSVPLITQAEDYHAAAYGNLNDGQIIAEYLVSRTVTFPADFAGSVGRAGVHPAADNTLYVKNGSNIIGTVTIDTGGGFSFSTTGNTSKTVSAGSIITIENQTTADADLADIRLVLNGAVTVTQ